MPTSGSQQADRIIFRVNPAFYAAITELAESTNRSVNGEICTAVDKWLYERDAMVLIKDRLLASASEKAIDEICADTPAYASISEAETDTCKTTVRFKQDVAADLRAAIEQHQLQIGKISLNSFLKMVVAWWLTHSYQLTECSKAIYQDFKNGIRPHGSVVQVPLGTCGNLAVA